MKKCSKCGETKAETEFHQKRRKKTRKDGSVHEWIGLYAECKDCWIERDKTTRRKYTEYYKEYSKNYSPEKKKSSQLKYEYGITLEQYNKMLVKQEGCCAICGSPSPNRKGSDYFHVDHCHNTGTVRGLLCNGCNLGLGSFKDSQKSLENAIEYLKQLRR